MASDPLLSSTIVLHSATARLALAADGTRLHRVLGPALDVHDPQHLAPAPGSEKPQLRLCSKGLARMGVWRGESAWDSRGHLGSRTRCRLRRRSTEDQGEEACTHAQHGKGLMLGLEAQGTACHAHVRLPRNSLCAAWNTSQMHLMLAYKHAARPGCMQGALVRMPGMLECMPWRCISIQASAPGDQASARRPGRAAALRAFADGGRAGADCLEPGS